jgi:hypothetical protein
MMKRNKNNIMCLTLLYVRNLSTTEKNWWAVSVAQSAVFAYVDCLSKEAAV